jgi:rhodanese-related sulfurtransferase
MNALKSVSPSLATELIGDGAVLVDIREADEHARERIPGARHHALSTVGKDNPIRSGDDVLIFHCRSGARTAANASKLAAAAPGCETYVLEGGLQAWKLAGLPVTLDRSQPIDIMRQVQIVAGGLVLAGAVLGALLNPLFYSLSGFVGAGLLFAGISGFCGLARLLGVMPWNRRAAKLSAT